MHRISVRTGETIYRVGEEARVAFMILSGEVATKRGWVTVTSGKGALIGFSALFNRPYGSTAEALSDCTLLAFSRKELRALIRSNPDEAMHVIDAIVDLLGRVADELEHTAGP